MKITIELSEEDAACIWANHHHGALPEIVAQILRNEAEFFRMAYPRAVKKAVEDFREHTANVKLAFLNPPEQSQS